MRGARSRPRRCLPLHLLATTTHGDTVTVARYLNSGFFVRRKGEWRAVGWQATQLPQP